MQESNKQPRVYASRECIYKPCSKTFAPKRVDMVFCSPECKKTHCQAAYKKGVKLMQAKGMRFSKLETSARLQRLYKYLSDKQPHSTREIGEAVNLEAVGSSIAVARRNFSRELLKGGSYKEGSHTYSGKTRSTKYTC